MGWLQFCALGIFEDASQHRGFGNRADDERIGSSSDIQLFRWQSILRESCGFQHFVGYHDFAVILLRQLLKPCGNIHGVAHNAEYNRIAIPEVASNYLSAVDPYAKPNWLALHIGQHLVQVIYIAGDDRSRVERLAACRWRRGIEP